ncbi:MAG TPA: efflux transporter outer membrane subunit [Tepidisphaeraceae bacterium]|jgi:NodT family efflux transporter outer membrane factor (OMF) lipoprotein|nr:efflux transporter outer membrane subunit [Tepidisphaeraceae bacterium]
MKVPASLIVGVLTCLGGCTVGPNYHTPATTIPDAYDTHATTRPAVAMPRSRPVNLARWWRSLQDPELDSLVQRAVAANLDLEIALTRLQEARTYESVVLGGALPVADFSGAAGRGSGTNSTKSRISGPLNAGTNTTGLREITQVVGFDAGWELDLFGRYRREIEAAGDETQAMLDQRNAVLISVVADVARAYMDYRDLQVRLSIAQDNIRIEQQSVDVVQERFNRGLTNELDLALARRQLETLQSALPPLRDDLVVAQRRIAVLLGEYPGKIAAELTKPARLPMVPENIAPGLPVDLLRRRPDIREAEREVAQATARVGVATANLFPRVAITAGIGMQGQGLGRTPAVNSFLWSAGPSAYWPLLDFGTLDALIGIEDLRTHEALVNYKRTILAAVEEVENAISSYDAQQQRLRDLANALTASQRAVDLAQQRYNRGLTDFLNVLDAERQLYELQDQYAVAQEDVVVQFISLYKGLGGGWEEYQKIPPLRKPQPAIVATVREILSPDHPEK